jgi:hypothetical protein
VTPPLIQSLIGAGIQRFSMLVGAFFRQVDERILIALWLGGGAGLALLVVIASVVQTPGWDGAARGSFAGVFLGLLYLVGFGSLFVGYRRKAKRDDDVILPRASALDAQLAPTLEELDALRAGISTQVRARSITRIPIGLIGGLALWFVRQRADDPPGLAGLLLFLLIGAIAGERWAAHALERRYRRQYKDTVLPQLASDLGELTYRETSSERVVELGADRMLPDYDRIDADDRISGRHAGLPIEIIEVRLKKRINKKTRVVFDGLLVGIELPRQLSGTTLIATDRGTWERFKTRWSGGEMEPVELEDQEFEQRYDVHSTNQIEARALLTPAFMERFVALASKSHFALPGAIADRNRLVVAMPKRFGMRDLFEPPAYWQPSGGQALTTLQADIRTVLDFAEAIMRLDFWAHGRLADSQRAAREKNDGLAREGTSHPDRA